MNGNLIINEELCVSCGGCGAICKLSAINWKEKEDGRKVPYIELNKCIKCGLCKKVCPIIENNFSKSKEYVNLLNKSQSYVFENNCFIGYSRDEKHRYEAATGGVATQIVKDLMNMNKIDGCLVVRGDNINHEVYIARTEKEIDMSIGSKYIPINLLKDLRKEIDDFNRIAIIGLPCQISAIRNIVELDCYMKNKIVVTVGLFCKQNKDIRYSLFLQRLLGARNENKKIGFRGKGWPGYVYIKEKPQKNIKANHIKVTSTYITKSYTMNGCFLCTDSLASISDISVGDAWNKGEYNFEGNEYIICNTKKGREVLDLCQNVSKNKVEYKTVLDSQGEKAIKDKYILAKKFRKYFNGKFDKDIYRILRRKKFYESNIGEGIILHFPSVILKIIFKYIV